MANPLPYCAAQARRASRASGYAVATRPLTRFLSCSSRPFGQARNVSAGGMGGTPILGEGATIVTDEPRPLAAGGGKPPANSPHRPKAKNFPLLSREGGGASRHLAPRKKYGVAARGGASPPRSTSPIRRATIAGPFLPCTSPPFGGGVEHKRGKKPQKSAINPVISRLRRFFTILGILDTYSRIPRITHYNQ